MGKEKPKSSDHIVDGEDLYSRYPTLMHYTTSSGLEGILKHGSLRCTHHAFLNDTKEIHTGMFALDEALAPLLEKTCKGLAENNDEFGQALKVEAKNMRISPADLVKQKFDAALLKIKTAYLEHAPPYICSFCCPTEPQHEENGLLSMWRAYGATSAYAVIFHTKILESFLDEEGRKFDFFQVGIDEVAYTNTYEVERLLDRTVSHVHEFLREGVSNLHGNSVEGAFTSAIRALVSISIWVKNDGFSEEREARIVCSTIDHPERNAADWNVRHPKFFDRRGTLTPFVDLLEQNPVRNLPIKKILIGPSVHPDRRKRSVEMFLKSCGYDGVEVDISKVPYIEH